MTVELPIITVSRSNVRENRFVRAKRTKAEREAARLIMGDALRRHGKPEGKIVGMKLTRLGMRLLDQGNLAVSMKAVQDGICDALGIDDGPWQRTGIAWSYDQRQVKRESTGVVVEIQTSEIIRRIAKGREA